METQPLPAPTPTTEPRPVMDQPSPCATDQSTLNQLINPQPTLSLQTVAPNPVPTVIDTQSVPPAPQHHKARRKGRVASLPKLQRDMVNRMLWNGVPYKNIVAALDEDGFSATERNISNWATGGYLEWRFEQDLVIENRLDQDHLLDHLRRDDAPELPEVGLQAAATRLSQILVQKTANAADVEANLNSFSQMVDVLCRLNHELGVLQKQRDDSRRSLGPAYNPIRIQENDQISVIEHERYYSYPPADSELARPAHPPVLPPIPTSSFLAQCDQEDADERAARQQERLLATLRAFQVKKDPHPAPPKPPSTPESTSSR